MGGPFRRALISVPTAPILANFYRRLVNLTRLPVAIERAHQIDVLKSRLVVGSQPTLWSRLAKFGDETLCVLDECHHANIDAPENLRIIERFRHVVGLSATPWSNGCETLFSPADTFSMTLTDAQRGGFGSVSMSRPTWSVRASGLGRADSSPSCTSTGCSSKASMRSGAATSGSPESATATS